MSRLLRTEPSVRVIAAACLNQAQVRADAELAIVVYQ